MKKIIKTEPEIPEPKYIHKEFIINKEKFVYDFGKMSISRILMAVTLFKLNEENETKLPTTPDELTLVMERAYLRNGFACLLMKKVYSNETDYIYERYNMLNNSAFEALDELTGDDYKELLECKVDFFSYTGLYSKQSNGTSMNSIMLLKELSNFSTEQILSLAKFSTKE